MASLKNIDATNTKQQGKLREKNYSIPHKREDRMLHALAQKYQPDPMVDPCIGLVEAAAAPTKLGNCLKVFVIF